MGVLVLRGGEIVRPPIVKVIPPPPPPTFDLIGGLTATFQNIAKAVQPIVQTVVNIASNIPVVGLVVGAAKEVIPGLKEYLEPPAPPALPQLLEAEQPWEEDIYLPEDFFFEEEWE